MLADRMRARITKRIPTSTHRHRTVSPRYEKPARAQLGNVYHVMAAAETTELALCGGFGLSKVSCQNGHQGRLLLLKLTCHPPLLELKPALPPPSLKLGFFFEVFF